MRVTKKLLDKYVVINWIDPQSFTREKLGAVSFAKETINGKIIKVCKNYIILEHASCDESGDYTILHTVLIKSLKILG